MYYFTISCFRIYAEANRRNRVVKSNGDTDVSVIRRNLREFVHGQEKEAKQLSDKDKELRAYQALLRGYFTVDKWMPPVESTSSYNSPLATSRNVKFEFEEQEVEQEQEMPVVAKDSGQQLPANEVKKRPSMLPPIVREETKLTEGQQQMMENIQKKVLRGGFDLRLFRRFLTSTMEKGLKTKLLFFLYSL